MISPANSSFLRLMRLLRIPEPFDHPNWLYEVKFDGFRALGARQRPSLQLVSTKSPTEGIVAKWRNGTYQCDGRATSRLKIKNPDYSQLESRHELFGSRRQPALSSR